jgi:methyl-accepting chemotaxis protein
MEELASTVNRLAESAKDLQNIADKLNNEVQFFKED